ncbi:MAG: GNAT family N-acetyltransferase [Candidatus Sumerlaeia bacterium]|nr:GNAT family N-acetyltransferase [Candidatus Sumerlaeia bacterium]
MRILQIDSSNADLLDRHDPDIFDEELSPARTLELAAAQGSLLLVASANGLVVGQCLAHLHQQADKPTELYLDNLGVSVAYRRRGIGRRLVRAAMAWGSARGAALVWVATEPDNVEALALYRSLGLGERVAIVLEGPLDGSSPPSASAPAVTALTQTPRPGSLPAESPPPLPTQDARAVTAAPSPQQPLAERLARHTAAVDAYLDGLLDREEQVANLHDAVRYALGLDLPPGPSRGKRIRPALCLAAAEALGADPADALPFAAAIELFHNFALVHDDIEDGDEMRRGRPCVYKKWGVAHGINIGDFIACKIVSTLVQPGIWEAELRLRLFTLISEAMDHTHIGQCLDIGARGTAEFTVDDYLRIVREKTGYYLAVALLGGAEIGGADARTMAALRRYGLSVGPLFQILDDVIDLTEGKGRGERGSDIGEGKRSYLVAVTLPRCSPEERAELLRILDAPREETTKANVDWAIALFERHGAMDAALEYCEGLRAEAMAAAAETPPALRALLEETAELLSSRRS